MDRLQNDELQIQEASLPFVDDQLLTLGLLPVVSNEVSPNYFFKSILLIYILFFPRL